MHICGYLIRKTNVVVLNQYIKIVLKQFGISKD